MKEPLYNPKHVMLANIQASVLTPNPMTDDYVLTTAVTLTMVYNSSTPKGLDSFTLYTKRCRRKAATCMHLRHIDEAQFLGFRAYRP